MYYTFVITIVKMLFLRQLPVAIIFTTIIVVTATIVCVMTITILVIAVLITAIIITILIPMIVISSTSMHRLRATMPCFLNAVDYCACK